jgi:hypothetical protein
MGVVGGRAHPGPESILGHKSHQPSDLLVNVDGRNAPAAAELPKEILVGFFDVAKLHIA